MSAETFLNGRIVLHCGDSRDVLKSIPDCSIDSIVTDPPYALVSIVKRFANSPRSENTENTENPYGRTGRGFMGQKWDNGDTAFAVDFWAQCLRVLKPGGHIAAFSGTRTYHRMACAIEDAGFEIRDMLAWLYGSGFPKSHDVSKGIDRTLGAEREMVTPRSVINHQRDIGNIRPWMLDPEHKTVSDEPSSLEASVWQGWGTALKPACEPICFGRKPLSEKTVALNVLKWGTGAINVDGCRVEGDMGPDRADGKPRRNDNDIYGTANNKINPQSPHGRWPANVIHDGSDQVIEAFPMVGDSHAPDNEGSVRSNQIYGIDGRGRSFHPGFVDGGRAARFFYTAKADSDDRLGSKHPTVKPVNLIQWLCRLITPPGGTILDSFSGTGTTGEAAFREGFNAVLIEREPEYQADIRRRMSLCMAGPEERRRESIKAKVGDLPFEAGSLFADLNQPIDPDTPPADSEDRFTRSSRTNDRANRNETLEASEQP